MIASIMLSYSIFHCYSMLDGSSMEDVQYWYMLIKYMWFPIYNSYTALFGVIASTKTYWTVRSCDHCYPSVQISKRQLRLLRSKSEWQRGKGIETSSDRNRLHYELVISNKTCMCRENNTSSWSSYINLKKKKKSTMARGSRHY